MQLGATSGAISKRSCGQTRTLHCQPQVLKLLRYAVKFSLVSALDGSDTPLAAQLRSFESSVGTTRSV